MNADILRIITGSLGTLGFSVLFNIRGKRLVMSTLGGCLSWSLFLLLAVFTSNEPVRYFIVSVFVALYAEVVARIFKTPTTTILMAALVPLIPGASLYYTMAYALESDINRFLTKAVYTLQLAGALALGIVVTTMVITIINKLKRKA